MNVYMNKVASATFSYFDTGSIFSGVEKAEAEPERLKQTEEKNYVANLEAARIAPKRIKKYGFAFEGKKVLIGEWQSIGM